MSISAAASSVSAQFQSTAPVRKAEVQGKVEGSKPDGDKDGDDKAASVKSADAAATTAVTGNVGRNINTFA